MAKVIVKISDWRKIRNKKSFRKKTIGFVPTMGALHKGHVALIKKSLKGNDITVVSVFVNPTQFNNKDDLQKYPQVFENDLKILEKLNVDFILYPSYEELYPDNYKYKVIETNFSKILCGQFRPGHFDGVLTVVLKLLNIVKPDKVYLGVKDYQQLKLIEGMVEAFFIETEIVSVPTVRDKNGLALSSRNLRLSQEDLAKASLFPKILKSNLTLEEIKARLQQEGFKVEYVVEIDGRRFGAIYLNNVRLIDNVKI